MTASIASRIDRAAFGAMPDGTAVERVTLRGEDGFEAGIITYGATLQSLKARDRAGRSEEVVLGHDDLSGYLARRQFSARPSGAMPTASPRHVSRSMALPIVSMPMTASTRCTVAAMVSIKSLGGSRNSRPSRSRHSYCRG